jgi:hypothetical protein
VTTKERERERTHILSNAGVGSSQDRKRKRASEGYLHPINFRHGDKSEERNEVSR